ADLEEDGDDAGVLADRPMALGAHARVDQDLRHRVLRRGRFLALVRGGEVPDVVDGVVVRDVLQGVGDALDEVFLLDGGHGCGLGACNGAAILTRGPCPLPCGRSRPVQEPPCRSQRSARSALLKTRPLAPYSMARISPCSMVGSSSTRWTTKATLIRSRPMATRAAIMRGMSRSP